LIFTPGLQGQMAVMGLDMAGVSISSGSACASGRTVPSHVLLAYGFSAIDAACGLRVSSGLGTTENDIEQFVNAYTNLCNLMGINGQKAAS
jgi:cysteine desulfurase